MVEVYIANMINKSKRMEDHTKDVTKAFGMKLSKKINKFLSYLASKKGDRSQFREN